MLILKIETRNRPGLFTTEPTQDLLAKTKSKTPENYFFCNPWIHFRLQFIFASRIYRKKLMMIWGDFKSCKKRLAAYKVTKVIYFGITSICCGIPQVKLTFYQFFIFRHLPCQIVCAFIAKEISISSDTGQLLGNFIQSAAQAGNLSAIRVRQLLCFLRFSTVYCIHFALNEKKFAIQSDPWTLVPSPGPTKIEPFSY